MSSTSPTVAPTPPNVAMHEHSRTVAEKRDAEHQSILQAIAELKQEVRELREEVRAARDAGVR